MIPDVLPEHRSEQIVFRKLKNCDRAGNWLVFPSYRVTNPRNRAMPREIDFLILIPQPYFCIICLEVKGGSYEIRDNGRWYTRSGEIIQSPLDQSSSAMYGWKNEFKSYLNRSPFSPGCAVVFTDVRTPEVISRHLKPHEAEIIWQDDDLCEKLENYADSLSSGKRLTNHKKVMEAEGKWQKLRHALEPRPMNIATPPETIFRTDLETLHPQLLELTNEQFTSLERVEWNPRCVIDGAAGTGKTVLAMELAKRRYEAGETVALLCSNPYLNRRLVRWAETLSGRTKPERIMKQAKNFLSGNKGRIVAGTPAKLPFGVFKGDSNLLDKHRERLKKWPKLEESLRLGYLDNGWHEFINETVADLGQGGIFDYLIVDEAQNLYDEVFLNLMDALLKGGLKEGRWTMFGDFTNQNLVFPRLTEDGLCELRKVLEGRKLAWSTDKLQTNCRNTQEIADAVANSVRIDSPPISGVHGPTVQIKYFTAQEELGDLLDRLVADLGRRKFSSRQIILLTSSDSSNNAFQFDTNRSYGSWQLLNIRRTESTADSEDAESVLVPGRPAPGNTLTYSDVYDFQGLESEVAILVLPVVTEVVEGRPILPDYEHRRRMLYTGMSRAKTMLIIVAQEPYKNSLKRVTASTQS